MDEPREIALVALVAAVGVASERHKDGGVFDVPAIASFVVDEIEAAGYSLVKTDRLERLKRSGRIDRRNNMMCQLQDGDLE